uniref:FkbM family methyltransferase n=1 Tax=Fervidicoccus fontis TaxID=683846 RepID=A0A7J3SLU7_9CREN
MFQTGEWRYVVDIGAHIGIFSLKVSKRVGGRGKVIAIEPEEKTSVCYYFT